MYRALISADNQKLDQLLSFESSLFFEQRNFEAEKKGVPHSSPFFEVPPVLERGRREMEKGGREIAGKIDCVPQYTSSPPPPPPPPPPRRCIGFYFSRSIFPSIRTPSSILSMAGGKQTMLYACVYAKMNSSIERYRVQWKSQHFVDKY